MQSIAYDNIGKTYDITRRASPEITKQLVMLLHPIQEGSYIDIACGSGNYTQALASNGITIEGIDVSLEMLNKARNKYPSIKFYQGDSQSLPFENDFYSGAICTLATHHFSDVIQAFREAYRVINKGAKYIIFTSTPEQMKHYWLCHYFPKMMEDAMNKMLDFEKIKALLIKAGFSTIQKKPFFVTESLQDFFLQSGKYRPEIYLDKRVRDGISSFHLSADQNELNSGLQMLENDIKTGRINGIISDFEKNLGDYLFICAEKP